MSITQGEGKTVAVLTEPNDWRFTFDPALVLRETMHRYHGGKPRLPDEVAATPPAWDDDLHLMAKLMQFQRDVQE